MLMASFYSVTIEQALDSINDNCDYLWNNPSNQKFENKMMQSSFGYIWKPFFNFIYFVISKFLLQIFFRKICNVNPLQLGYNLYEDIQHSNIRN